MKNGALILACAVLLSGTAFAASSSTTSEEPKYTYVEGGWSSVDSGNMSESGSGPMMGVSWGVTELFHVVGSYEDVDFDVADSQTMEFGAGLHRSLSQGFDLLGEASYVDFEVDDSFGGASENGFAFLGGARKTFGRSWEAGGTVEYVDLGDYDDTLLGVNALYTIQQRYAFGAGYKVGDDDTVHVGFRMNFGNR
jgi:hypothetical protein